MADDLRKLSDELASDPGSMAFLRLGELLRTRGDLDDAWRVAQRGRERHPALVMAHDLAARVALDRGDVAAAGDAWHAVLRLDPAHAGALKGLGFVAFREGRLREAVEHLTRAAALAPGDASIATALDTVRSAQSQDAPAPPAMRPSEPTVRRSSIGVALFADLASAHETILLVDKQGLVLAASSPEDAADRNATIGAQLTGVSEEADRAMRHLELGAWTAILIEAPDASAALAPAGDGGVVMVTAPHATPLGLLKRLLDRGAQRARDWLAEAV